MTIPTPELNQIIEHLRAGEKEQAAGLLRQVLKHNPHNVKALVWLGGLTTHTREGIIALERALKLDPGNVVAERYLDRWRALQVGGQLAARWGQQNLADAARLRAHHLAILIDGDNARPGLIGKVLNEARKYGSLQIRRIYGDWTRPSMNGWKRVLQIYGIQPIQQFQHTTGKNATDSALIIDAMDILHGGQVDGFCLVSSDSDYTRLATRISESGLFVMGVGKKKTPRAFVNACDLFVYTETLLASPTKSEDKKLSREKTLAKTKAERDEELTDLLSRAFEQAAQPDGRAYLGTIGIYLQRLDPSFDPRKYGYRQLSQLVKAQKALFETETVSSKIYVRLCP